MKKFCRQHDLDVQLIDSTLTYAENKKYLNSLVPKDLEALTSEYSDEWYMSHHFLSYYVACILAGETKIKDTKIKDSGKPMTKMFSLRKWVATKEA